MKNFMRQEISDSIAILKIIEADEDLMTVISDVAQGMTKALKSGKKVMFAGNGGSAADSQHLAAELVGKFCMDRPGLPGMALTTDSSILTAIGNDYGFDKVFERQVLAHGNEGDMFVGISTSGNSVNLVKALLAAKEKGVISVGLTGSHGGDMKDLCDFNIRVPSSITQKIQEAHILIGHSICAYAEKMIFAES